MWSIGTKSSFHASQTSRCPCHNYMRGEIARREWICFTWCLFLKNQGIYSCWAGSPNIVRLLTISMEKPYVKNLRPAYFGPLESAEEIYSKYGWYLSGENKRKNRRLFETMSFLFLVWNNYFHFSYDFGKTSVNFSILHRYPIIISFLDLLLRLGQASLSTTSCLLLF